MNVIASDNGWTEPRPITARQLLVLETIGRLTPKHGFPPSLREIGRELGIRSTHGVDDHIQALIRKGHVTRTGKYASRNIVVVGDSPVPRTKPAESGDLAPQRIPVYASLVPRVVDGAVVRPSCAPSATGVLVMHGEGLSAQGIRGGDSLFIDEENTREIRVGKLVVVRLDAGVLVRGFAVEGGLVKLGAGDGGGVPFMLRPDDFRRAVLAVVVGVFRSTEVAAEAQEAAGIAASS